MATTRRYKSLENPKGRGEVYCGDERIGPASYDIHVREEMLRGTPRTPEETPGHQFITGSIRLADVHGKQFQKKERLLTLHMQDGRKLDFHIRDGRITSGWIPIVANGIFY